VADPLLRILADAFCLLDTYVADRPEGADSDFDVKVMESVASILLSVPDDHRQRLIDLLDPRVARENGLIESHSDQD